MSHTSESVPPSLGAMFLNLFVFESKTATLDTLPKSVPLRCSTREKRPPSQMLVPTCSIALTRPSTVGVSSGFSDGNASTAPLARKRATATENNNKKVLLISISFSSGVGYEKMKIVMADGLGVLGPSVLKGSEGGLQRLPLDYIDVPLDGMLRSRTASRQFSAQVNQDLLICATMSSLPTILLRRLPHPDRRCARS